jgi:hypothetical protein
MTVGDAGSDGRWRLGQVAQTAQAAFGSPPGRLPGSQWQGPPTASPDALRGLGRRPDLLGYPQGKTRAELPESNRQ